ncbi:N-6 DNA methylase [Candidatus Bathyarchaeota archaeon]|nr:N-6 DNA methylase [Desulfobacterales bacterium]NIU81306.1 N-6 DNA methylase [Candidatus Bathyarchaeota archaeon]
MEKFFFLLSGEHPTLPFSELKAILEAEDCQHQVLQRLTQVLRLEADTQSVEVIESRSAMTRICGLELFSCHASITSILEKARSTPLEDHLREGESFAVRVRRIRGTAPQIGRLELEGELGEIVLDKAEGAEVNLGNPEKTFWGVLTENSFLFGIKLTEISAKSFRERDPQKRPFFHPSAMPAKLARCMVNLARPQAGDLVLDPFCGTGSMLLEAGLMGCRVMGLDAQPHMVRGSLQNLRHYGLEPQGMTVADARHLPITQIGCVVTDPPYGRSATTMGWKPQRLIKEALSEMKDRLLPGRWICVASPEATQISRIGQELGLKLIESHLIYVHSSLTREVAVFRSGYS